MRTNSDRIIPTEGNENQNRDYDLEAIVGNMLISQYQAHILKSRIVDRLDEW